MSTAAIPSSADSGQVTPPVYSRDFAYANGRRVVLAHEPMRVNRPSVRGSSARNFAELLAGPTVNVFVGSQRKRWSLHLRLLCHHSSYFETELRGDKHNKARKDSGRELPAPSSPDGATDATDPPRLELPEDDPRGFELLVKWLYQGQLEDVAAFAGDEKKYDYAVACHKLYLLCEKFDMVALKNAAMDLYRRALHDAQLVPDAEEMNEIYRAGPAGSPFRKLMTMIAARQIMDPDVEKDAESYRRCFEDDPGFAVEMINAIRHMSGGMLFEDPTAGEGCEYHDHSDGSRCHGLGQTKAVRDVVADGAGPKPSRPKLQQRPASPVAQRPLPAELSAKRRTPRKIANHPPPSPHNSQKVLARKPTAPISQHVPDSVSRPASIAPRHSRTGQRTVVSNPVEPDGALNKPAEVKGIAQKKVSDASQTARRRSNVSALTELSAARGALEKQPSSTANDPVNESARSSPNRTLSNLPGGNNTNGVVPKLNSERLHDAQSTGLSDVWERKRAPVKLKVRSRAQQGHDTGLPKT